MTLEGVRVLVDGYNLERPTGTGIKTYGLNLIRALKQLGAGVDVLLSAPTRKSRDTVPNEVLFFDAPRTLDWLSFVSTAARAITTMACRARDVPRSGAVITRAWPLRCVDEAGIMHLPRCYDVANILYKRIRFTTRVTPPRRVDIWHASYPLPIRIKGARTITAIHDLIPLRLPYLTWEDKAVFFRLLKHTLASSALILTLSETSKEDLVRIVGADPQKVAVTYLPVNGPAPAVNASPEPHASSPILRLHRLPPARYLLSVGTIEPRKNIVRLIEAYAGLDADVPLVIVGPTVKGWESEAARIEALARALPGRVQFLGHVGQADLSALYEGALGFVFPSLYEGFGLPPIEAMSYGCPVLASRAGALPEICGDAAIYADPYDVGEIRSRMADLVGSAALRARLAAAGKERAKMFSADQFAGRLAAAYQRVL